MRSVVAFRFLECSLPDSFGTSRKRRNEMPVCSSSMFESRSDAEDEEEIEETELPDGLTPMISSARWR